MKVSVIISAFAAGTAILAVPVEQPLEGVLVGEPIEIKSSSFQFTEDMVKRSAPPGNYYQQPYNPVSYRPPADTSSFLPESQYRDAIFKVHNNCREAHGVPALKWSQDMVNYAQANTPTCAFAHSRSLGRDSIGENILYGPGSPESMVQTMWYDKELKLYNFARQGFAMSTGHMTQMVWKATTEVGCAVKKCPQGTYVKCNYRRPGNVSGQFESNVPAPRSAVKNVPSPNYGAPAPKNNYNAPAPKNNYNTPAPKNYNSPAPKNNGYYQTNNNGYYQTNNNGYYRPQNSGNASGGSTPNPKNGNTQNRRPTYTYTYTYRPSSNSNNRKPKSNTASGQSRNTGNGYNRAQSKSIPQYY